jgi:hypothetical protein
MRKITGLQVLILSTFVLGTAPRTRAQQPNQSGGGSSTTEVQALKARIEQLESQNQSIAKQLESQSQAIARQSELMTKLLTELKAQKEGSRDVVGAADVHPSGPGGSAMSPVAASGASGPPAISGISGAATGTGSPNVTTSSASGSAAPASPGAQADEAPLALRIGRATLTPVGFLDFTTVFRSTNGGAGLPTNFGSIPFANTAAGNLTETRVSAQNSRIGVRVDADVKDVHVFGYLESDFLGTPAPGNLVASTNGNIMRMREYYVDVRKDKLEIVGGQAFSLLTPNRRGLGPEHKDLFYGERNLDPNEQLGLVWARQAQVRFIYNASDTIAMALSLENPDQYIGGSAGGGTITLPSALATPYSSELDNGSNGLAVPNVHPDVIAKIAFDPMVAGRLFHIEAGGVARSFRVYNPISKDTFTATGGGGIFDLNFELFKNFRLLVNNFYGDGAGRYTFGQAPDLVVRGDGSLSLVHSAANLSGIETRLAKNTWLYAYYGVVYSARDVVVDPTSGAFVGYGFPGSPSSNNRVIHEPTFDVTQTLWRDPRYGGLQLAMQYSYVIRHPWSVAVGAPGDAHVNMVFLGLRYYFPGEAPKTEK